MRHRISLFVLMLATMASAQTAVKASMIAPTPGTTLRGPKAMFIWSAGSGAQAHKLDLGNSVGASDILSQNAGLDTSLTVKSLPTDCRTVYVRLSTLVNNAWEFNDYTYNACGQQAAALVASASNSTPSACGCEDVGSLRHRLEEVSALKAGLEESLKAVSASEPATPEAWASVQNGLRAALPQLSYTSPATPATIAMFNNYVDPLCGRQNVSAGACLDQMNAAHQAVHDPSCRAGRWRGQQSWTMQAMIEEELQANQAELTYLQSEPSRPSCACASPFALVVQVVTASAISMPGINESSSRSLNGQQGIVVPVNLHPDGTFEGQGSGTDSGNAAAYAAGGYAKSQFGHAQTIQASGVITPGNCSTQPCGPDMMHLVLSGVGGPQTADMQARFPGYSANMNQVTSGGAGVLQFDLPAYVGQQAQRVLLDMGMLKSNMSVTIVSGDATGAQQGASLLYSAQQCGQPKAGPSGVGAPAPVGVVGVGGGLGGTAPGGNSNTTQNAPQSPPTTPDWVTITMTPSATTAGNVRVNWSPVDTAQSYNVYRNLSYVDAAPNEKVVGTVPAGTTTFTDTSVPLFIAAYYSVTAVNVLGESPRRETPVTRAVGTPDAPVWGFADTHTHPFVDRAFGGNLFWGRPFGPMNSALADCSNAHPTQQVSEGALVAGIVLGGLLGPAAAAIPIAGPVVSLGLGPLLGPALGTAATDAMQIVHPGSKGAPAFDSWPRFDTKIHQMMFESWLYRAHVGGLRLMVSHAVNNETICDALKALGHVASGRTCDDMEAVALQLQDARDMEAYINSECASGDPVLGCVSAGVGWFHVVTSSAEARQTINRGQLAVVLGIEVDHPFGCGPNRNCSKTFIDNSVQAAYSSGVRYMFPIHLSDNPFGGMALYGDMFAASSQHLNGEPVQAMECPVDADDGAYTFRLSNYPQTATCNAQGLTDLGKFLMQDLAVHHMIVDIDHMSRKAVEDSFTVLAPFSYPLVSGHNTLVVLHQGAGRTEAARTTSQVTTIKALGGIVSIGVGDVGTSADVAHAAESSLPNNCSNSSNIWFQSYARAVGLNGGWDNAAVALSTDQGLTDMLGPRYKGSLGVACPGGNASEAAAQSNATRVPYPFSTLTPGTPLPLKKSGLPGRTFDFNTEGMAHFGLFPDFVQDLRSQGVTDGELGPLFRSAEAFLQTWARAEQAAVPMPVILGSIVLHSQSSSGATSSWVIVNATDSLSGAPIAGTVLISSPNSPITGNTGTRITFPNCYEVTGTGSNKQKTVASCSGKVNAAGYSQVTFTAP